MCLETVFWGRMWALLRSVRMDKIKKFIPVVTNTIKNQVRYIGCICVTVCLCVHVHLFKNFCYRLLGSGYSSSL